MRRCLFGALIVAAQSAIGLLAVELAVTGSGWMSLQLVIWGLVQARGLFEQGWRRPKVRRPVVTAAQVWWMRYASGDPVRGLQQAKALTGR